MTLMQLFTDIDVNQTEYYQNAFFLQFDLTDMSSQVGGASTGAGKDEGPVPGVIAHLKPSSRSSVSR